MELIPDTTAGDWIAPFDGRIGSVQRPARVGDGHRLGSAEVCAATGCTVHALMQRSAIARVTHLQVETPMVRTADWAGSAPGGLPRGAV